MSRNALLLLCGLLAGCSGKDKKLAQSGEVTYLQSPAQPGSGEPFLFTDLQNQIWLSWIEQKEDQSRLKSSRLTGAVWSEPITVAEGKNWFVNWADYPVITANRSGFAAAFLERNGEGTYAYDVKFTLSSDGKTWTPPAILHDDGKQAEHGFVSWTPYAENFFVSWLDGRNTAMEGMENHEGHHGQMTLRGAILDKEGRKLNEWELDGRVCDCCQTTSALTDNGPVVFYRDRSPDEIRDISIVRFVNGAWTKPAPLFSDHWKIEGCPVNGPRASSTGNNLAVAWFSMPGDTAQVKVIFSNDGGATFGKPIRVDEGNPLGRVDIELTDHDHALVSWMEGSSIKLVKVSADGTKEKAIIIATTSDSRASGFPQMTRSGDQLIFAWTDDKEKMVRTAILNGPF